MTHAQLVRVAETWLRKQRCRIVLSEQTADSGEVPDAIGWRADCHSIVIECKVSRGDFISDQHKRARQKRRQAMGCERLYLAPAGLISAEELPDSWGLLELDKKQVKVLVRPRAKTDLREKGLLAEMALLLASLRRVEVRIEPQTITEFLKWKHRMAAYNGGQLPKGLIPVEQELSATEANDCSDRRAQDLA
jgi:hypothetical protein